MLAIYWVVSPTAQLRDEKQNKNIIRLERTKVRLRRNVLTLQIKVCALMWARLTWCRRKSRRIVCGALIFTDFSTYSEQVALKSSLAALERDGRTRRWSIAVISCETSAHLHSNHAWITLHGKGGSRTTHLQRKPTFPSALTVAQMWGWVRWSESCLFDPLSGS